MTDGTLPVVELGGRLVVRHHGDPAAEDRALHEGAALVDRSHRGRISLSGPRAAELLTGLVTNDVLALLPGSGQYAAMLTPKGKIVADVRIFALADAADPAAVTRLLVDCPARATDGLLATVRKFVNPRLAPYRDEREQLAVLGIHGPRARDVLAEAIGVAPDTLASQAPYASIAATLDDAAVVVARSPELLVDGWDLVVDAAHAAAVRDRLTSAGVALAGLDAWEIARVEAGRPEWGLDMDDNTIPQEANFDELGAISYTKGCYTGQETVARVHFRGHVNRHLRHVRFDGDAPAPRGAELVDEMGKVVGDVRSGASSPRAGAIAIAMVRREAAPGARLLARWEGGELPAVVAALPYAPATTGG